MSIATEKVKLATERFLLVRLNPARFITPASIGGGVYEIEMPFSVNRLERNGTELTKVSTLSGNDQWTFDESTFTLQVQLASAPNSTTNILVAFYYLFYTGTVFRSISEDPEDDTTPTREWEPRIQAYPTVLQSFDNIQNGVFTISDTSLLLINEDGQFQDYLTDDDSFYNKQVDIWLCINDVTNIQRIFTGTVTSISLGQNVVTVNLVDSFNKLKQPALMGDTADESYFSREASSFPDTIPKASGAPIPYIIGKTSRYQTQNRDDAPAGTLAYELSVGTEAVCISFDPNVSGTVNRDWGACRQKSAVATQSFGAVQATTISGDYVFIRFASYSNVNIGDTLKWVESAVTYYGRIAYVGSFTFSAVNYNIAVYLPAAAFTVGSTVANIKSFAVFLNQPAETPESFYALYERDYTVSETATSGSNTFVEINFVNGFEGTAGRANINPNTDFVFYRTSCATVQKHGDILKEIATKVGLPVNAASFTAADAALPVNCKFHIPNFDEQDFDTYLKYVQDVLKSTLGYLRVNSDFEVEYELLTAPTSTEVRDSFLMLDQSTVCEVEYEDIVTKIIAYNPHNDSGDAIDDANTPAATGESFKARYLHGLSNVDRFRHVLEELTSKIDDHINLKSMRQAKYIFQTATQDIDTELGDDLQLDNKIVLGNNSSQDVKVITIEKSPSKIYIESLDLKGL